eukprot:scaffold280055_cov71-Attheya_sp.AAC.1
MRVNLVVKHAKGEKATWISPRFMSSDATITVNPPNSYAHAVLQQQPKAELLVMKLTIIELAKCNLDTAAIKELSKYFHVQLKHAVKSQASLGLSKALYKRVDYK